ncbi:MAG: universal stress protein [Haloarculaceae archaeon]
MILDGATVLVPVDVSDEVSVSPGVATALDASAVVLLGYYPVPEQAAPAQIKGENEAVADRRLAAFAERFDDPTRVLVFTGDSDETVARVAGEHGCDAVLTLGTADVGGVARVLVALRGETNLDRIVSVVGALLRESDAEVTLFHAQTEGSDLGEFVLRGAADRLTEAGVDRDRIDWRLAAAGDPVAEIASLAGEYDLVVLGESKPSLRQRIFGTVPEDVTERIDCPTLVVRNVET